jgi:hypothetical protein
MLTASHSGTWLALEADLISGAPLFTWLPQYPTFAPQLDHARLDAPAILYTHERIEIAAAARASLRENADGLAARVHGAVRFLSDVGIGDW